MPATLFGFAPAIKSNWTLLTLLPNSNPEGTAPVRLSLNTVLDTLESSLKVRISKASVTTTCQCLPSTGAEVFDITSAGYDACEIVACPLIFKLPFVVTATLKVQATEATPVVKVDCPATLNAPFSIVFPETVSADKPETEPPEI